MDSSVLQQLVDRLALDDLMYRQAMAVDRRDWASYRACLASEIDFDFGGHLDEFIEPKAGKIKDPDTWMEIVKTSAGFDKTMHMITNMTHQIDGDRASSVCYMLNEHIVGTYQYTAAQIHHFDSLRTEGGWKLYRRRLGDIYGRGNPAVYQMAVGRVAGAAG